MRIKPLFVKPFGGMLLQEKKRNLEVGKCNSQRFGDPRVLSKIIVIDF